MIGRIARINVSRGGVPKLPVVSAEVGFEGLVGDWQNDRRLHGGPERALCLWSLELIELLQREGHPVAPGSTGENLTIAGLDWAQVRLGARMRVGSQEGTADHAVLLEITSHAIPCRTIWHSFRLRRYGRISPKRYPGQSRLYARVLQPGTIATGDLVVVND